MIQQGRCTNLPQMCSLSASGEVIEMPSPDTRCPQCGMPLQVMRQVDKGSGLEGGGWARPAAIIGVVALVLVLGVWLSSLVKPTSSLGRVDLVLSGSNSIGGKLGPALARAWLESEGGQKVRVEKTGEEESRVSGRVNGKTVIILVKAHDTGSGFKDAAAGRADIVMASRSMKGKEGDALGAAWTSPTAEHVIAYDGIAVIVSPHNTVQTLSLAQLRDIYTGQITDWAQVGGVSGRIHIFAREPGSGTRDGFISKALHGDDIVGATEVKDSAKLEGMVAEDRNAIGFVAMPYVKTAVALSISTGQGDAFAPTMFTVRSERYPLYRRLYLYTTGENPRADPFLAFVRSDDGQKVVKEMGFVDLRVETDFSRVEKVRDDEVGRCRLSNRWDGDRDEYCSLIRTANLQPAVIKFRSGSDELDSLARDDVQRFLRAAQANPSRTLILAGHADSLGSYGANCRLSIFRAESVRRVLAQNGVTNTSIRGFCDEIPRRENRTADGRDANRRVELLVR